MIVIIVVMIIFSLMYVMGLTLKDDLKRMEDNDPKMRKYYKDKYGW